jgi:HPr kinase/phosphorylase
VSAGQGPETLTLHATCVARKGRGLLITGPSGAGKSGLALQLIALGARLVADDQTILTARGTTLTATCPPAIRGLIEARGMGLLPAPVAERATVVLCVDLGATEDCRLPPHRAVTYLGRTVSLVLGQNSPHFAAALMLQLEAGRRH